VPPFVSEPFPSDALGHPWTRADVELLGVDLTVASYEGRVFVNNPSADASTERGEGSGYVGSFHVFGKEGCWGERGHCDPREERRALDRRRDPTVRAKIRLTADRDVLRRCVEQGGELTVTVVPAVPGDEQDDVLRFERMSIVTYR
jgi:hypothetical protein